MNWKQFKEEYGEGPEEHYEDPAEYQEKIGNKYYANRIRKKREEDMSFAEDKIIGFSCSWCGVYFKKEHGYPVLCNSCWKDALKKHKSPKVIEHNFGLQKAIHKEL